jgi:serine/threonine protein kinase
MAEIFKAEHRHPGQIRGFKVLLPELAAEPDLLRRLLAEARTMAGLRHPAIAEVHDFDVQGDSAFIVMEHLPGMTLRTWCDHVGKLARNPGLAAAIAGTLADGLAFAHQHGVVHRDLKPENVIVTPAPADGDGFCLKIVDFGVARMVRDQPLANTRAAGIGGTPFYKAPEQWRLDGSIDHRADVYALGCLLFELLCGQPPFCERDARAVMRAHLADPPPDLTVLEPEIPSRFQTLIGRMLAKSAEDRLPSMQDVLTELEAISGRRRSQWSTMLRTPREGTMAARGTLVISLELATIVDRADIPERRLPEVRRLLHQAFSKLQGLSRLLPNLASLRTRMVTALSRLLPNLTSLRARMLTALSRLCLNLVSLRVRVSKVSRLARPKLDSLLRSLPIASLRRLQPPVLWTFLKTRRLNASAPRFAVILCAGVMVAATLLWATRVLLTSNGGAWSGAVIPLAPLPGPPKTALPTAPTEDLLRDGPPTASERPPPRVRRAASPVESPAPRLSPRRRRKHAPAGLPHRDGASLAAGSRRSRKEPPSPPPTVYRAVAD